MTDLRDRLHLLTSEAPDDDFDAAALLPVGQARLRQRRLRIAGAGVLAAAVVLAGVVGVTWPHHRAADIKPAGQVVEMQFSPSDLRVSRAPRLTEGDVVQVYRSGVTPGSRYGDGVAALLSDGRVLLRRADGRQWGYVDRTGVVRWWTTIPGHGRADRYAGSLPDGSIVLVDGTGHWKAGQRVMRFWVFDGRSFRAVDIAIGDHASNGIDAVVDFALGGDRIWFGADDDAGIESMWSHPFSTTGTWRFEGHATPLAVAGDYVLEGANDQSLARLRNVETGRAITFRPPHGCAVGGGTVGDVVAISIACGSGRSRVLTYDLAGHRLGGVRVNGIGLRTTGRLVGVIGDGAPNVLIDTAHDKVLRTNSIGGYLRYAGAGLVAWEHFIGQNSVRWFVARLKPGVTG